METKTQGDIKPAAICSALLHKVQMTPPVNFLHFAMDYEVRLLLIIANIKSQI